MLKRLKSTWADETKHFAVSNSSTSQVKNKSARLDIEQASFCAPLVGLRLTSSVRKNRLLRGINKIDRAVEKKIRKSVDDPRNCQQIFAQHSIKTTFFVWLKQKYFPSIFVFTAISHNAINFARCQKQSSEKCTNRLLFETSSEPPNAWPTHPRLFWHSHEAESRW